MQPDPRFLAQPKSFWAYVRSIGEAFGYAAKGAAKIPTEPELRSTLLELGLGSTRLFGQAAPTELGKRLLEYFEYRADALNQVVEPNLMAAEEARALFQRLKSSLKPKCPLPENKQKGAKKAPAYLTCIINMLVEAHAQGITCDYDPRALTTIVRDGLAVRTLARRLDGAFPGVLNPIAVWEIKEYYYTTTFGSRVTDGVYESLLDGMGLEELRENEGIDVKHYLMVDAHYTWWECGKSYLCRIIDMLHMGYLDEVLFGKEVVQRLPVLVGEWASQYIRGHKRP